MRSSLTSTTVRGGSAGFGRLAVILPYFTSEPAIGAPVVPDTTA